MEPRIRPVQQPPAILVAGACLVLPVASLVVGLFAGNANGFLNDFSTYWLAGKLVWSGHSPYDLVALTQLGRDEALRFLAGTGYSYPLPFALVMVPFGWLPFLPAGLAFVLVSLLVFAVAVTTWLTEARPVKGSSRSTVGLAALAGAYPPVLGSVFFGQANLLVLGLLALAVRLLAPPRGRWAWGGAAFGLAGAVKVVPLIVVVPLVLARRWRGALGVVGAAVGAVAAAGLVAPFAWFEMSRLLQLGVADPYWTNQSLNGFASRLVLPSTESIPPFPDASAATIAWTAVLLLAAATFVILLWRRHRLRDWDGLALGLALALVAAVAAAPKDSFWDQTPALLGAAMLLAVPGWRGTRWRRPVVLLLAGWFLLAGAQLAINALDDTALRGVGAVSAYLASLGLASVLVLWVAIGLALAVLPNEGSHPTA